MKTIDEYMKMPYKLEIIPDSEELGFVASYPDLPGCITCGSTISDAVNNAEDAKKEWLLAAIEENIPTPNLMAEKDTYSATLELDTTYIECPNYHKEYSINLSASICGGELYSDDLDENKDVKIVQARLLPRGE